MNSSQNVRFHRVVELILVIFVAFVPHIFSSTYTLLTGSQLYNLKAINALNFCGIVSKLTAIAVLMYVLFRQGRNLKKIGFSLSWKDIPVSLLLGLIICIVYYLYYYGSSYGYYFVTGRVLDFTPKNIDFLQTRVTIWYLLLLFVNPFYEELIARAYVISEMEYLTKSRSLAVILSIVLQASYHLYQGFVSAGALALMFLIYSLYYIRWRRITPVILAHMYFDLFALIAYAR